MKIENVQSLWCLDCKEAFTVYKKVRCCPYCTETNLITMQEKQARLNKRIDDLQMSIKERRKQ